MSKLHVSALWPSSGLQKIGINEGTKERVAVPMGSNSNTKKRVAVPMGSHRNTRKKWDPIGTQEKNGIP